MKKLQIIFMILVPLMFLSYAVAEDEDYAGTYVMKAPDNVITLTLNKALEGIVTGTMTSSKTGLKLTVEGQLQDGFLVGACYNDDMSVYFESGFEGDILYFTLIEPDANNMPDYNKTTDLQFTRSTGEASEEPASKVPPSLRNKITGEKSEGAKDSKETPKPAADTEKKKETKSSKIASSSEIVEGEVGDKNWGFKFKLPSGWVNQQSADGVLIGHNTIPGMILILPHNDGPFDKMKALMADGVQEAEITLKPSGELKKIDDFTVSGYFEGEAEGTMVKAYGIATVSPLGENGAYIVALTTPENFNSQLTDPADQIFKSMTFFKTDTSGLAQNFVEKWTTTTTNTTDQYYFYPNGKFSNYYESSYSDGGQGDLTWGTGGSSDTGGAFKVRGTRESGVLVLTYGNGNVVEVQYAVHVENGETYWNEYYFDGSLYGREPLG